LAPERFGDPPAKLTMKSSESALWLRPAILKDVQYPNREAFRAPCL
jgi:hypothetical protein